MLWDNQFIVVTSVLNSNSLGTDKIQEDVYLKEFAGMQSVFYQTFFPARGIKWNGTIYPGLFENYAKTIYNIIAAEVMMCDWEDPTGYNTLGL